MAGTIKLLLMGIVGQGKSTLGNFIVKDPDTFKTCTSMASVTGEAKKATLEYNGKSYCVVDTPGFCDSEQILHERSVLIEVQRGIEMTFDSDGQPGVDAVILVISAGERFGKDQEEFLASLEKLHFWKYVIVAFTNADRLGNDPEMELQKTLENPRTSPILKQLMETVSNRYVLLNAIDLSNDNYQVKMDQITKLVEGIQEGCNHQPYTSEMFEKVAKEIKSKQELLDAKEEELAQYQQNLQQLRRDEQNIRARIQQAQYCQPVVVREIHYTRDGSGGGCTIM